ELNGGSNTLLVTTTVSGATALDLRLNGGFLDLKGNTQISGLLTNNNPLPGTGGVVTSVNPAVFVNNSAGSGANTVFGGSLAGAVSYYKTGSNAVGITTFTSPLTHTGSTNILAGGVILRDSGAILNSSAVNVKYATLTLDNQGLTNSTTRIGSTIPVNLSSAALVINGRQSFDTQTIGAVNLAQGHSSITINELGNTTTGAYALTLSDLSRNEANGGVVSIVSGSGLTLGGPADDANVGANPRVFLNQVGGANFNAAALSNGIIGGWAVATTGGVGGFAFATYQDDQGVGRLGQGAGFAGYGGTDLSSTSVAATANINDGSSRTIVRVNGTSADPVRTFNSVRLAPGGGQTITIGQNITSNPNGGSVVFRVGSGGLMTDANQAISINAGDFSSSLTSGSSDLFAWVTSNTTTINSPITGSIGLVKSGAGTLTLAPSATISSLLGAVSQNVSTTNGSTTVNVADSSVFYVGMPVAGNANIPGGAMVASIVNGTTITISAAATGTAGGVATSFGDNTTVRIGNTNGLVVGMPVSGTNVPAGATVTSIIGTNHFTISAPVTASGTQTVTYGNLSNAYTGTTIVNQGVVNLNAVGNGVAIPGNLLINGATVNENARGGQIAATADITINGTGVLNAFVGAKTFNSLSMNGTGGITAPALNFNSIAQTGVTIPNSGTTFTAPSVDGLFVGQVLTGSGNIPVGTTITAINTATREITVSQTLTGGSAATNQTITYFGGGSINLTAANAISAATDNVAVAPVIAGGTLQLSNAAPVIQASGIAPVSLVINSAITSAGGNISKSGVGSVMLGGQSTFNNGFTLNEGTVILSTPSTGLVSGPFGAGTLTINAGTLMGAAPGAIISTTANSSAV
ncbi:MAG: hypothetical protein JNG86_07880, partial [Verrucomicrobiaceae bacterium]|nr:hypothetical protein [Verrucomicrobiaceae bacterium]